MVAAFALMNLVLFAPSTKTKTTRPATRPSDGEVAVPGSAARWPFLGRRRSLAAGAKVSQLAPFGTLVRMVLSRMFFLQKETRKAQRKSENRAVELS